MSSISPSARALAALDFDSNRLRAEVYAFKESTPVKEVRDVRDALMEMHGKITALMGELTKEGQTFSKRFGTYPREYTKCILKCCILLSMSKEEPTPTSPRRSNTVPAAIRNSIHLDEKQAEELMQTLNSLAAEAKNIWDITSVGKKTVDSIPLTHKKKELQKPVLVNSRLLPVPLPGSIGKLNSFDETAKDSIELNRKNNKPKEPIPTHRPEVPVGKTNNASLVSVKEEERLPPSVPVAEETTAPTVTGKVDPEAPKERGRTLSYCPPPRDPLAFVLAKSSSTLRQAPILTEIKIHCKVPVGHTLFIRGSGAGLNWDFGVPLTKIDEGTYVYRVKGARGDLEYQIYLDDTQRESGEKHRVVQGKAQELTPDFTIPEVVAPVVEAPKPPKTTQIAVNYDVGFGNALFIRGSASPLNWGKGVEMHYKDGKWVYETSDVFDKPIEYKFLVNDKKWENGNNHKIAHGQTEVLKIKF